MEETATTYTVTVPYKDKNTIAEQLEARCYDWVNSSITDEHFPRTRTEPENVEIQIIHFGRPISTEVVLKGLDEQGLRPANVAELLAFGAAHPDVQRQFPVIALDQLWCNAFGSRYAVYLDEHRGARRGNLCGVVGGWNSRGRFAAIRKSP
jgi:hypothetical protein